MYDDVSLKTKKVGRMVFRWFPGMVSEKYPIELSAFDRTNHSGHVVNLASSAASFFRRSTNLHPPRDRVALPFGGLVILGVGGVGLTTIIRWLRMATWLIMITIG